MEGRTREFFTESATSDRPASQRLALRIAGSDTVHVLSAGPSVVGSSPDADIQIGHGKVSRAHAEVSLVPAGVRIRDLGSKNGSFYLEQRFTEMTVAAGASFRLGEVVVQVLPATTDSTLPSPRESYAGLQGYSLAMKMLFASLERLEASRVPVLVLGPPGSGRSSVASAIHAQSRVARGPLEALRCAEYAHLAAPQHRLGEAYDRARGGSLYLRSIEDLPLEAQYAILGRIENRSHARHGDGSFAVRILSSAASMDSLERLVDKGLFLRPLLDHLATVTLHVAPLGARPEDLVPLALAFAAEAGVSLPREALEVLRHRSWPRNVAQLRTAVEAYAALGSFPLDRPQEPTIDLELAIRERLDLSRTYADLKDQLIESFTRVYIPALLASTNGNQTAAAKIAQLDRTHLGRLIARYDVEVTKGRAR